MTSPARPGEYSAAVTAARDYYNTSDADIFYATIWGGEDKHIGVYDRPDDDIVTASRRAVERMAAKVEISPEHRVLDVGSGYGGVARQLVRRFGCTVSCLNLSEVENERNRRINDEEGLSERIEVVEGSFEDIPFDDGEFDLLWSQDAFLHSGDPTRLLTEVLRVLAPDGDLVFSDLMASADSDPEAIRPLLERLRLQSMSTVGFYRSELEELGVASIDFEDLTPHLLTHYRKILAETERRRGELEAQISAEFARSLEPSLQAWVDGAERGDVTWGIFHVRP